MSSVDGETKSLLDTTAGYVSSKFFGPIDSIDDGDDNTNDDKSCNNDDESGDETTTSDVVLSSDILCGSNKMEKGISITRKGSLHVIASTLAKIANVQSTKGNRGDNEKGVLDGNVKNQFESFMHGNDPDLMDHIVVDDGKEISIHAIRMTSATASTQVDENTETRLETMDIDPTSKQHDTENTNDDYEATVIENDSEKSFHVDQASSFADCICPFTTSYPETERITLIDSTEEATAPFDEAIPSPLDAESTVELERNVAEVNVPDSKDSVPVGYQPEIHAAQFDVDAANETEQVDPSETVTSFTKVASTAENSLLEETASTRPFSFFSYVIPLSPIPSMNYIDDAAKNVNQIIVKELEGNDENGDSEVVVQNKDTCTTTPINPPAKWSMFTPFVTSYVDSNRNTDIHGKDPVGNELTVDEDVENGMDPIGDGPILFTNSIDKSVTPPWDREDPPTATHSSASTNPTSNTTNHITSTTTTPDIETPVSNDQNEPFANQDIEDSPEPIEEFDDVECTMKGPVEQIFPEKSVPNSKSIQLSLPSTTSKGAKTYEGKYNRYQRIVVLLLLLLGALSLGVYFIAQNQSKKSSRVVSASQVDDSPNSSNQNTTTATTTKTNAPIASPTVTPTEAPVKNIALRPTKAPTKRPTSSPSNQPSIFSSDDDNTLNDDDDAKLSEGSDDDNNSGGDDNANNTDDGSVGDDDDVVVNADDDGHTDDDTS